MDVNGDRNGDFSLMAMTNIEAGTFEVRRSICANIFPHRQKCCWTGW